MHLQTRGAVALAVVTLGLFAGARVATAAPDSGAGSEVSICGGDPAAQTTIAYRLAPSGPGTWTGLNAAQAFQVELSAAGARLAPLATASSRWEWRFSLARSGAPGELRASGQAFPVVSSDRAELLHGRTTEWFINSPKGLQHGVDIPEGTEDNPFWLDFAVGGGLTAKVGEDGESVAFVDAHGTPVLAYRDLRVVDHGGRGVDARWERIEGDDDLAGGLRLSLATADHPFPIRIMGRIGGGKTPRPAEAAPVRAATALAAPGNDLCTGAEAVPASGPFPYLTAIHDITDATTTGDPPTPSCQANISRSIWFRFTPAASSWYTFSLCEDAPTGTTVGDTVLAIYSAAGDCAGLAEQAGGCDDDSCSVQDFQSVLTDLSLTAGTTYYIVAWQYGDVVPDPAAASLQLQVTKNTPPGPAPPNDQCAGAETIPGAGPFPWLTAVTADIGGAGTAGDPPAPACQANVSRSIWYSFTPAVTGRYAFSTCADAPTGTTVDDTVMALYASSGPCAGLLQVTGGCDDDSCASEIAQSVISGASLAAGTTYYLVVWQYGTAAPAPSNTAVQVRVSQVSGPANDACDAATPLALDTPLAGTTTQASNNYQLPGGSACYTGIGQTASTGAGLDVVYRFTAPATGRYSFRAGDFPSTRNAVLYVATDCPAGAPPVAPAGCLGAANRNAAGPAEEVSCLALAAGQTVFVYVDENAVTSGGPFTVEANACTQEAEPNNAPATGDLACGVEGAIGSAGDADFFSLGVPEAGARVFALADGAAANSTDFDLRLTTALDTLEYDDQNNDLPFGASAPNLAGAQAPGAAAFLRVSHYSAVGVAEPYHLYGAIQPPPGAATPEAEPNGTTATATFAANQYWSGALSGSGDVDLFGFTASAGEDLYLGLDLDPLRNSTPFNGTLALLDASGAALLQVNDSGSTSSIASGAGSLAAATPYAPGEGLVYRVRASGTYYARVAASGSSIGDYLLSVAHDCRVLPANDLSLAQSDTPDPAAPGQAITYTVTIHNLGSHPATGVRVRDDPPAGAIAGAMVPSQGTCAGIAPVYCDLGTLAAGATATMTLSVTAPAAPGSMVNQARVSTFVMDTQPANDSWTETTQVGNGDSDGDGVADAADCAPADPAAWAVPGEATDLIFPPGAGAATLQWTAPAAPGGTLVYYDLLRSASAGDFSSANCVATGLTVTSAGDPASPSPRWFYLVRARNTCGGNLGPRSDGTPRTGVDCHG